MEIKHRVQLPELLKHLNLPLIAVELGSAEGLSAFDFMNAGLEKLYMVDNWQHIEGVRGDGNFPASFHDKNYAEAKERLKPFGDSVVFLKGLTSDMAVNIPFNSVGMVYVDADHSYSAVKLDIAKYWDKLVKGGIMAFHDYEAIAENYGVKQAVQEFAKEYNLEIFLLPENKLEDAGAYIIKP